MAYLSLHAAEKGKTTLLQYDHHRPLLTIVVIVDAIFAFYEVVSKSADDHRSKKANLRAGR